MGVFNGKNRRFCEKAAVFALPFVVTVPALCYTGIHGHTSLYGWLCQQALTGPAVPKDPFYRKPEKALTGGSESPDRPCPLYFVITNPS
jgi:hypothetical protein